jgi:pyruvate/2-oxoglutarate dehydrogenase complex dihydrolipoamide dehydrogenase (E3) component
VSPTSASPMTQATRVAILGGGPGGYEAALVAAQLGADVTVVERDGLGGSTVLTDVVPSKTLIATAELMSTVGEAGELGVRFPGGPTPDSEPAGAVSVDLARVNGRVKALAAAQSNDVRARLEKEGVRILCGRGALDGPQAVVVADGEDAGARVEADIVLLSTGSSPRTLPDAQPDGERILTWKQVYDMTELPEHLIVVGSGVTCAPRAS